MRFRRSCEGEQYSPVTGPRLHMLSVRPEGQEKEDAREDVCPAHDARDGLDVDRVDGEDEARGPDCGAPPAAHHVPAEAREEPRGRPVGDDVGQVVAQRVQAADEVVQPKGGDAQRTKRLVRPRVGQRRAPEVVFEKVAPR